MLTFQGFEQPACNPAKEGMKELFGLFAKSNVARAFKERSNDLE